MTEDEARERISANYGKAATARVAMFLAMVVAENEQQNLIAPSTVDRIWARHALDSEQLIALGRNGLWVDIGTGGGFPGLLVALLRSDPVMLVEPRRRRAAFLESCIDRLELGHASVVAAKVESITAQAAIISARAVAAVENILHIAAHCANEHTRWLLPRGRFGEADMIGLKQTWEGVFHVEQSLTDPQSSILVLDNVRRR